jgi:hypothetical protein
MILDAQILLDKLYHMQATQQGLLRSSSKFICSIAAEHFEELKISTNKQLLLTYGGKEQG